MNGKQIHERAKLLCSNDTERHHLAAYVDFTNNYLTPAKMAEHTLPLQFMDDEAGATKTIRASIETGRAIWKYAEQG